jgi:hypothetical protein
MVNGDASPTVQDGTVAPTPVVEGPKLFLIEPGGRRELTAEEKEAKGIPASAKAYISLPQAEPGEPAPLSKIEVESATASLDSDGDGLSDEEETKLGTDPYRVDTDGDSIGDFQEIRFSKTDPLNPQDPPVGKK